jgi:hypothetical protein
MMYMTIRCRYCRGVREDNAERYRRGRASTPGATGPLREPLGRLFLGRLLLVHTMADLSDEDAAAEHAAFARVLAAFRAYPRFAVRCPALPLQPDRSRVQRSSRRTSAGGATSTHCPARTERSWARLGMRRS